MHCQSRAVATSRRPRKVPDFVSGFILAHVVKRADGSVVRVEKRPGQDWLVDVLVLSENEIYPVTVFGAVDEEAARQDAVGSFSRREAVEVIRAIPLEDEPEPRQVD